jgi:hypothetical protein
MTLYVLLNTLVLLPPPPPYLSVVTKLNGKFNIITVPPTLVQPVQEGGMVMAGAMSLQTCKWQLYMQQLLLEEETVGPCSLS